MKKLLVGLLVIIILIFISAAFLIPSRISVVAVDFVARNSNAAFRSLSQEDAWLAALPSAQKIPGGFVYEQDTFRIHQNQFTIIPVQINNADNHIESSVNLISLEKDSTAIEWKGILHAGENPLTRVKKYRAARNLGDRMKKVLQQVTQFLEQEQNIYGLNIKYGIVQDTLLVATRFTTSNYPATNEIYQHIDQLKSYIVANGAKETNHPMLHVQRISQQQYESMVAIPTSKELKGNGTIVLKKMVSGNILEAEVKGGNQKVEAAIAQMDNYIHDHQLTSPAIPFALLVTDRMQEADSSKWVSKVYYPIL